MGSRPYVTYPSHFISIFASLSPTAFFVTFPCCVSCHSVHRIINFLQLVVDLMIAEVSILMSFVVKSLFFLICCSYVIFSLLLFLVVSGRPTPLFVAMNPLLGLSCCKGLCLAFFLAFCLNVCGWCFVFGCAGGMFFLIALLLFVQLGGHATTQTNTCAMSSYSG